MVRCLNEPRPLSGRLARLNNTSQAADWHYLLNVKPALTKENYHEKYNDKPHPDRFVYLCVSCRRLSQGCARESAVNQQHSNRGVPASIPEFVGWSTSVCCGRYHHPYATADSKCTTHDRRTSAARGGDPGLRVGGDSYANCWAGDPSCINLPANSQHPMIGHYIPFAGIQMLANYARCLDQTDCDLVSSNYECKPLRLSETASGPFKPRVTYTLNVYSDAAGNPEKVCQPKSVPPGTPPIPFVNSVQARKIEFSYWRRAKPGWLLYWKKDDTTPDSLAWISGSLPLDVSNPDVATEVLGRIRRWPYLKEYYGAISLDTVGLATPYTVMYRCRKGGDEGGCTDGNGWEPLASGPDPVNHGYGKQCLGGYCYPAWTSLVLNWVTTMRDTAHTLGLNLVINVSYGGDKSAYPYAYIPADDQKLLQLFDTVDGVFDEGGFTSGNLQATVNGCVPMWTFDWNYTCGSKTESQNRWSNFSRYLLAVQARGKPYFSKNATPGPGNLLIPPKPEPQPQAQAVPWSLASFLMSRGTSPSLARQAIYMAEKHARQGRQPGVGSLWRPLVYGAEPTYWTPMPRRPDPAG